MPFLRQSYKQKPSAWGPASSVQASIFKNAEKIGINPASIALAMPMWGPGGQLNYITGLTGTNNGCTYQNNSLLLNSAESDYISIAEPDTRFLGDISIIIRANIATGGAFRHFAGKHNSKGSDYNLFDFRTNNESVPTMNLTLSNSVGSPNSWNGPEVSLGITKNYTFTRAKLVQSIPIFYINHVKTTGTVVTSTSIGNPAGSGAAICIGRRADGVVQMNGLVDHAFIYACILPDSQIAYLSDNPYFLLQRVPPVFYSVPGGGITITTSLDGKVIIRTATAALLDCMASIKNNASNILDGAAVVSTTKTDAIDGKTILKSVASSIFDSKASVLSIASLLLDGKAIVSDTGSLMFAGKGTVKDSTYDIVDGKSIVKSNNTAILDGKSIFLSTGTTVIDGKVIVNAEGFSSSFLDGKTSIKSVATNYLDGLIYIGNAADKNIDGKAIIKSSVGLTIDGKITIQDVASNLLDGSASILTSIAHIVDGKIIISDAAIGLLDGNASIMDDSSIVLDGKVFLSSGSEINIFDGRITLSVPIVGKVMVSFSMRSPSVSFAIKTPAATISIN